MACFQDSLGKPAATKVKSILDFNEIDDDDGVAVASAGRFAPLSRQITMPVTHLSTFYRQVSSWRPSNSVKALKAAHGLQYISWYSCLAFCFCLAVNVIIYATVVLSVDVRKMCCLICVTLNFKVFNSFNLTFVVVIYYCFNLLFYFSF